MDVTECVQVIGFLLIAFVGVIATPLRALSRHSLLKIRKIAKSPNDTKLHFSLLVFKLPFNIQNFKVRQCVLNYDDFE